MPQADGVTPILDEPANVATQGGAMDAKKGWLFLYATSLAFVHDWGQVGFFPAAHKRDAYEQRVHEQHDDVVELALADISAVKSGRFGFLHNRLWVETKTGSVWHANVAMDRWSEPLRRALTALGRAVSDVEGGFRVD